MRTLLMITALLALTASVALAEKDNDPAPVDPGYVMDSRMDEFGYVVNDECGFTLMDISGSGMLVGDGDDALLGPIPLGEDMFNFYDTFYSEVYLSTNGFLSFYADDYNDLSNVCPYPDASYPNPRIAVLHDDLDLEPGIGTAWYEYFEICPQEGRFGDEPCTVVMWNDVGHYPGGNGPWWDQEAILFHYTGDIVLLIGAGNPETGSSSTTAIARDGDPAYSITIACDEEGSIPDDSCFWIWHPEPVATEATSFSALKTMYK